jgi:hypothetical protein
LAAVQFFLPYRAAVKPTNIGAPGAKMYVYIPGTTTKRPIYSTSSLTTQLANPVTADGSGAFPVIYMDGALTYKIVITDKAGSTLQTFDPYIPGQAPDATALQPYQDAAAASATAASSSASAAATSAASAASSASAASTSATEAQNSVDGIEAAIAGLPAGTLPMQATSRAIMAGIASPSANMAAVLSETDHEGLFVAETYDSAKVTNDPNKGCYVASTSAPGVMMWTRKDAILHPRAFDAKWTDNTQDSSAALNAMHAVITTERHGGVDYSGDYGIASGLTIDSGTYGADLTYNIDFGMTRITALGAISRMLTLKDTYRGMFSGSLHLRGTGYLSDSISSWTCDTGLYIDHVSHCVMPENVRCAGFGYAGVEYAPQPADADTVIWRHVNGGRIGSGSSTATMCETSSYTWDGNQTMGAAVYGSQYSEITVAALPRAYAAAVSGTAPLRQLLVEISGRLHQVSYLSGSTLRVFPALRSSYAHSGTLTYHYGALVRTVGNDSNVNNFGIVWLVGGGCAMEFGSLYGHSIGVLGGQNLGTVFRTGATGASTFFGNHIDYLYCEGNKFNEGYLNPIILAGFKIGTRGGDETASKTFRMQPLASADAYSTTEALVGATVGSDEGGFHYRRNRFLPGVSSSITLDLGLPRTIDGLRQVTYSGSDGLTINLTAANSDLAQQYSYYQTSVQIHGRGVNAKPAGGLTFHTSDATHTINGAAAGVDFTIPGSALSGPALVSIWNNGTAWDVQLVAGGATGGGSVTQSTSKATGVTLNKPCGSITMNNAALAANTTVAFTLTNSTIAADDNVVVRVKSGYATAATYRAWAEGNASGSRTIILQNISAGSLSEAVVLGFTVIKSVSS